MFSNKRWILKESPARVLSGYDGKLRRMCDSFMHMRNESTYSLQCQQLRQRQFFLALVSERSTCLLELASDARRVRASILMLDGRVIGAVFGRRSMPNKVFGRNAYLEALAEFAQPEAVLTVRTISNSLALTLAPLLRGGKPSYSCSLANEISLQQTKSQMLAAKAFGCAFLSDDQDVAHTLLYFTDGQLVSAYSYENGTFAYGKKAEFALERGLVTKQVRKLLMPVQSFAGQFQLSDIEGASFATDPSAEGSEMPIELLKRYSERSDLVGALTKNRASISDQRQSAMRVVENWSVRRASRDHAHRVNPFH
jgi:hypothetical protein